MNGEKHFKILTAVAAFLLAGGLVAIGLWAGFSLHAKELRSRLQDSEATETMGGFFDDAALRRASAAYSNPERAFREMRSYTWSVPVAPTPFVGVAPIPGSHGTAVINSMQFRDEREIEQPKPTGTKRIFLVGGSTAFGVGAPDNASIIGRQLESLLNQQLTAKFEVFTFACPSWLSTHERIAVENRLSDLEPDLVIALSGFNDSYWSGRGRNILWSMTIQQRLFGRLLNLTRDPDGNPIPFIDDQDSEAVPLETMKNRIVMNIRLTLAALGPSGAPYLYCLQPLALFSPDAPAGKLGNLQSRVEVKEYLIAGYPELGRFLSELQLQGFAFLNLAEKLSGEPSEIFIDNAHLGDRGNRVIAEAMLSPVLNLLR